MPHQVPVLQMDRQLSTVIKQNLDNLMRDDDMSDEVELDSAGSDNSRRSSCKKSYNPYNKKYKNRQSKYFTDERTVYVADLQPDHTEKDLVDVFRTFGDLAKVVKAPNTPYAYVTFEKVETAKSALNKTIFYVGTHPIRVMPYIQPDDTDPNANLIIKNLECYTTEKDLIDRFKQFGEVLSCKVVRDGNGHSKCFAFLQYKTVRSASLAIDALNNTYWEEQMDPDKQSQRNKLIRNNKAFMHSRVPLEAKGKKIYVGVFKKKEEYLKSKSEKEGKPSNLYVKNLGDKFNDHDLYELFKPYGCIKSAKIRRYKETNRPMGCGFVDFENPDDSERAIAELDGHVLHGFDNRVITVKYAECKSRRVNPMQSTKSMIKQNDMRILHDIHNNENNAHQFDMNEEYTSSNLSAINNYLQLPFTSIENKQQQQHQQQQQISFMEYAFYDSVKKFQAKPFYSLF